MKNFIRSVTRLAHSDYRSTVTYAVECDMFDVYLHHVLVDDIVHQIGETVAKAYVEQHGAEILKHLNEKTIDAKVIQKVIANVRKELKGAAQ